MAMDAMAAMLGLPAAGPLSLMSAVAAGLPLATLDRVVRSVAPADNKFAFRIVPRATLARRRGQAAPRLSPEEGTRLARLALIWELAVQVWKDEAAARRFLFKPHMMLEDRAPIDVALASEFGGEAVREILGRLLYGTAP